MTMILNQLFRNSRVYIFLCALAGISPLVGVQGYKWDYAILMFYYFAEAVILMAIGVWKILACNPKTTPDGSVRIMPSGRAKIIKGNFEETVQPASKSFSQLQSRGFLSSTDTVSYRTSGLVRSAIILRDTLSPDRSSGSI